MNDSAGITDCRTIAGDAMLVCERPLARSTASIIGRGAVFIVAGYAGAANARLIDTQITIDESAPISLGAGYPRDDAAKALLADPPAQIPSTALPALARNLARCGGYWFPLRITASRAGSSVDVNIRCRLSDGRYLQAPPIRVPTARANDDAPARRQARADSPRPVDSLLLGGNVDDDSADVYICMATYNPDPIAFERQIESICRQGYRHWRCIVCDDASPPGIRESMRDICSRDARIAFVTYAENLGFYANFERALSLVPEHAAFVALADQDDEWYADKLERLLANTDVNTSLIYSDMRIVGEDGVPVADSYWTNRRNNHKDADIILLANTVTGAASMFPRRLLDIALPFPERIGDAFHDHWLACCALASGELAYVDAPLYDYRQHGSSVIGHCDFESTPFLKRFAGAAKSAIRSLVQPKQLFLRLVRARASGFAIHRQECRRIELILATLSLREPHWPENFQRGARLFSHRMRSGWRLLLHHLSVLRRGQTTNHAELRLGMGYLITEFERCRYRLGWFARR